MSGEVVAGDGMLVDRRMRGCMSEPRKRVYIYSVTLSHLVIDQASPSESLVKSRKHIVISRFSTETVYSQWLTQGYGP